MAADEHNILLTPVLKTDEVEKSAAKLRDALTKACTINPKDLDNLDMRLDSLQRRMREVTNASAYLSESLKKLRQSGVSGDELSKLTDQLAYMNDQMRIYLASWQEIKSTPIDIQSIPTSQTDEPEQNLTEIEMVIQELSNDVAALTDLFSMRQNSDFRLMDDTFKSVYSSVENMLTDYYLLIEKQKELNKEMETFLQYWYTTSDFMKEGLGSMKKSKPNKDEPIDVTYTPVSEIVSDAEQLPKVIDEGTDSIVGMTARTQDLVRLLRLTFGQAIGFNQISRISTGVKSLSGLLKNGLVAALKTVKEAVAKLFAMIMAHPIILVVTAIVAAIVFLVKKIKGVIDETKEQVDEFFKALADYAKRGIKQLAKFTAALGKSFIGFYESVLKNSVKLISMLISKLKSLKSTVEEGIKKMAQLNKGSNEINTALSNLTSSLTYVKNALSAAFVPILTTIEPILTRLLNLLGDLLNAIGALVAKLTGATTYRKAIRQQKDFAKSLEGVGNAAGAAEEKLASYDKLDVISKNKGNDIDSMFKLDDIENIKMPEWLEDLYELGTTLGVKLRDALNNIPWDSVKEGAQKAAKAISDFINGFFNVKDLGKSVGHALGELVNTITTFINGLFDPETGINWNNIALQLGQGLTELINTIDFTGLGQIFSNVVNATADFVSTFIDEWDITNLKEKIHEFFESSLGGLEWPKIKKAASKVMTRFAEILNAAITPENFEILSTTLAETLNTIFIGVQSFVESAEFKQWGDSLGTGIMNFFKKFDFPSAGTTISNLANGILDMISSAIDKIEEQGGWDEIGDKLVEFISNIKWEEIGSKALEIAERLREGFGKIWDKLKETDAFSQIIQLAVDFLNEKSNWDKMFEDVKWDVVKETLWTKLKTFLSDLFHLDEAKEVFANAGEFFGKIPEAIESGDLAAVGQSIILGILEGIKGMLTLSLGSEGVGATLAGFVTFVVEGLKHFFGIGNNDGPAQNTEIIGTDAAEGVAEGFNGFDIFGFIKKWWDEKIAPWFTWDKWVEICQNVKGALLEQFGLTETDLSEIWENIKKKPMEIFEELKEAIKAPLNGVLTTIENFINDAIDAVNKFTSQVNKIAFDMPTFGGGNVHFGVSIPQLDKVQLPRLAQGAIIPPNREFAAILGDQRSGTNIETPLDTMIAAFRQALSESNANQPILLQLNGRTIAQAVWDEEDKRYKQTGRYRTI